MSSFQQDLKIEKFVYDYLDLFNRLITFLDDNNFDIKFIGFVIEIRDRWEEAFDILCFKDCCDECKEISKNLTLDKLMEDTRDIYKELGKRMFNRVMKKEIIKDKMKFEYEYLSVMDSINKYFSN